MAEEDEHFSEEGSNDESASSNEHRRPSDIPAFRGLRRRSEDLREKEEARARAATAANNEFQPQPGAQHMNNTSSHSNQPMNDGSARSQPEKLTRGLRQNPPNTGKERRGSPATFVVGESARRKLTRGLSSNHAPTSKRFSYSSTESRNNSVVSSATPPSYHRPPRAPDPDGTRLPNAMVDDGTTDVETLENDSSGVPEEQQYDEESASFVTRENSVDGGRESSVVVGRESSVVVGREDSGIDRDTDQTPASAPGPTIEPESSTTDEEQQEVATTTGDNTSRDDPSSSPVETAPATTTLGDESLVEARRVEEDDSPPEGMLQAEEVDHAAEEERKQEMERQRRQFRNRLAFVVCLFLALAILLLAVFIRPQDDIDTEAPTMYPTGAPSEAPTVSSETSFRESLPAYSRESLIDPDSVQSKAWDWLTDYEEEFQNMTDWRREQLFALASFYYAFAGPTWGIKSWLSDQEECYWFYSIDGFLWGDELFLIFDADDKDERTSLVFGILSGYDLNNSYSYSAEDLAETLEEKYQGSSCNEEGTINFIGLSNVVSLEDQTDPPVFMPPEIELLEDLVLIDLSRNGINTSLTSLLPVQMSNIPSLEVLYLHGTETIPQYIHGSIPSYIGEFPSLKFLDLGWNELTGTLPTELAKLDLYELDLGFNCLEGRIPTEIGLMTNLIFLELQANAFTGPLPTEIFGLTNLQVLGLPVSVALPANINELLPNINLIFSGQSRCSNNNATAPSAVFPYLANQTDLSEIDLRGQGLIGSIPTEIGLMTSLIQLSISDNFLTGPIPSELGLCTNLLRLEMSNCALDGPFPTEIGMLSFLQFFSADNNAISGSLPSELGNLGGILSLDLRGNQLSGSMPTELGVVPLLNLVLTDNELEGSIPTEFGQLSNLVWMDLANNQGLSGSLPSELGLLGGDVLGLLPVFRFDITNTSISGTIPVELGRGLLREFNATGTQLLGTVPQEICSLENEDCNWDNFGQSMPCHLNFDCSDQLCGCSCDCQATTAVSTGGAVTFETTQTSQIITSFGNDDQAVTSANGAAQDLSTFLPDYTFEAVTTNSSSSPAQALQWLILEYTDFNGLPTWRKQQLVALCTVYYSTGGNNGETQLDSWMDSSVNECVWSGGECTAEGMYERLDLSSKGLAGRIPPEISLLADLKALNLSSNLLWGPIPTEIGLMTQLTNLELHNNQLTGPIPSELGSLWNLELLRLGTPGGNNSFFGEVPNELRVLTEYGSLQLELGDLRINFETEATERQPSGGTAGHGY